VAAREHKTGTIATGKQFPFSVFSAMPHRANGMNDKSGGQAITPGQFCLAGLATVEQAALAEKFRTGSAMDCPIDPSAAKQRAVSGVDNGVNGQDRDVRLENCDSRGRFAHGKVLLPQQRRIKVKHLGVKTAEQLT
jgi:hypothetical protein